MKKLTILIISLLSLSLLTACGSAKISYGTASGGEAPAVQEPEAPAETADRAKTIEPMPCTLDIAGLDNCSVAAGFTAKDIYLEDYSRLVIHMTVYDAEYFDAEAVAGMEQGDFVMINGELVEISSIQRDGQGAVVINDSIELSLADSGNYTASVGGAQVYSPIGTITLPVAQEFLFRDCSDISQGEKLIYPGDMIMDISGGDRIFTPDTTTVTVSDRLIYGLCVLPNE